MHNDTRRIQRNYVLCTKHGMLNKSCFAGQWHLHTSRHPPKNKDVHYSGQLRQPQVPESIAKGKNLLAIIPIIFVRQHFCYFYYTCMFS